MLPEPTHADLEAVAAMLPELERIETQAVSWRGVYAPHVQRLMSAIAGRHVLVSFDWGSWQDWQRFLAPPAVATATLEDVRRLLTLHVRADRFNGGHFGAMVANGHIAALLRRLGELVRAQ